MAPTDDGDPERPSYVRCHECGTKASADRSFCRNCEASLGDAEPVDERPVARDDGADVDLSELGDGETGCPKCGHTDAEVDDIATTGAGVSRLFDVQNRRYRAVSCTRCGYTEFYRGRRPNEVVDPFIG
jgi:predicted nucleic-acid-binding Zn-ribbon protein